MAFLLYLHTKVLPMSFDPYPVSTPLTMLLVTRSDTVSRKLGGCGSQWWAGKEITI